MARTKHCRSRAHRRKSFVAHFVCCYGSAVTWGLVWAVFVVGILYGGWRLSWSTYFNVSHVGVSGQFDRLNADSLRAILRDQLRGNLFRVPIVSLSKTLQSLPWVQYVSIQRVWPNQIQVYIKQRQVAARFNQQWLIDSSGQLFAPAFIPVKSYWHLWGKRSDAGMMLQQAKRFQSILLPTHWAIQSVYLNDWGVWRIICQNGTQIVFGERNMINKLSLFVNSFSKIHDSKRGAVYVPRYIDLRYPNGFSIQWKDKKASITS